MSGPAGPRGRRDGVAALIDEMYTRGTAETDFPGMHPLFPSTVSRTTGEAIRDLVIHEGARQTLEVGLAMGVSCLRFCEALLAQGSDDVQHVAIDPFQAEYFGNAGLITIRSAGVEDIVEFHAKESQIALAAFVDEGRRFDAILVDGDHTFDGAFVDCYFAARLLREAGVLLIDDCTMSAVRLIVAYLQTNLGFELLSGSAGPEEFSWNRGRQGRVSPTGRLAALRKPLHPVDRSWDSFEDFTWAIGSG